nr:uncharacterized protein LOC111855390 [Paramormyrops kingsleyae]
MFRLFGLLIFINTALAEDVDQPSLLMRVQLGDSVTLTCFCPEERTSVAWFKQTVGQKPQLMAKALRYVPGEFYKEYKNIKRYSLQNAEGSFNLTISNAEPSDSAVYYCAAESYNEIHFGNGTFVIITGVIYSHRNRSDECEKSPEAGSPTQSCVYSLPKRNLSPSDAGTYYCAVAMCGEMLFGNGTQLHINASFKISDLLPVDPLIIVADQTNDGGVVSSFKMELERNLVTQSWVKME